MFDKPTFLRNRTATEHHSTVSATVIYAAVKQSVGSFAVSSAAEDTANFFEVLQKSLAKLPCPLLKVIEGEVKRLGLSQQAKCGAFYRSGYSLPMLANTIS